MSNNQMSNNQVDSLIKLASQKLGTDPNTLKKSLEQGNTQSILNNLSPAQRENLTKALNNPKAIEQLLNSPQAKAMLNKMTGGK